MPRIRRKQLRYSKLSLAFQTCLISLCRLAKDYPMRFNEIAPQKPLSPEEARLKSMKDRVRRDQEAVKAERARQQIRKAQKNLTASFT